MTKKKNKDMTRMKKKGKEKIKTENA